MQLILISEGPIFLKRNFSSEKRFATADSFNVYEQHCFPRAYPFSPKKSKIDSHKIYDS